MKQKKDFVQRLSWFLDNSIRLPGGYRIGVDGIIGLIPGIGDAIGGFLSGLIIYHAHKTGVPPLIKLRMLINVLIDSTLGAIPVLGDIFDFVWKANQKNADLMAAYQQKPEQVKRRSLVETVIFFTLLVLILAAIIWLTLWIASSLWTLITTSIN